MKQKKTIKQIANELAKKLQFKEKPFIEENTKEWVYYEVMNGWYDSDYYHLIISQHTTQPKPQIEIFKTAENIPKLKQVIRSIDKDIQIIVYV